MADATKYHPISGGSLKTDLTHPFSVLKTKKTVAFAYGFTLVFVVSTVFLASSPSTNASSPWFVNLFSTSTGANTTTQQFKTSGSQFTSVFSYFSPKTPSSPQFPNLVSSGHPPTLRANSSRSSNVTTRAPSLSQETSNSTTLQNQTQISSNELPNSNHTGKAIQKPLLATNQTAEGLPVESSASLNNATSVVNNATSIGVPSEDKALKANQTTNSSPATTTPKASPKSSPSLNMSASTNHSSDSLVKSNSTNRSNPEKGDKGVWRKDVSSNYTASLSKKQNNGANVGVSAHNKKDDLVESLMNCDLFDGEWVKDDSYPLYEPGSCPIIDEQFSCIVNGRPDKDYQKYKWKPKKCHLPRLDASHMLEMLRGKRLVFVGDSLNRNMWESLICVLRNSVKDKSKVFEVNGRQHFRGEASYSFIFKDYNCSIELYVSPFLVQEWETQDRSGSKKETLRLDLVGRTSDQYKGADIIIFNTGHWWTHEKTSLGKDYYQEGSHVYGELNVLEAFRKALTTWGRWVDANINPAKTALFFRGYSESHFSGGQWNSGGQCDCETAPIKNETYLREYPPKMAVLERVLKGMKTHVSYMNITRMTDFRKDGHPSIYGKRNLTEVERRSPLHYQDCSHWCLPGVPDAWNEILYTELLVRQKLNQQPQ